MPDFDLATLAEGFLSRRGLWIGGVVFVVVCGWEIFKAVRGEAER